MISENRPAVPLLGALCVTEGMVSQEELDTCLQLQTSSPTTPIGQILRQQGYLSDADLARVLAQQSAFRRTLSQRVERQYNSLEVAAARERSAPVLQWESLTDDYCTYVRTSFAELRVNIDPVHTPDGIRFCAHVVTIAGLKLATTSDLVSLDVARAWCETRYAEVLRSELVRLEG